MIKLTTEKDIIQSLILRSLGESTIKFNIKTKRKTYTILEVITPNHKFILSAVSGTNEALRVYDDGHIYLIPNDKNIERMAQNLLSVVNHYTEKLSDFYTDKYFEDAEGVVITWIKKE